MRKPVAHHPDADDGTSPWGTKGPTMKAKIEHMTRPSMRSRSNCLGAKGWWRDGAGIPGV
jgi:hypothetical protein